MATAQSGKPDGNAAAVFIRIFAGIFSQVVKTGVPKNEDSPNGLLSQCWEQ